MNFVPAGGPGRLLALCSRKERGSGMAANSRELYWFGNRKKKLRGFMRDGEAYLRLDELLASASGEHPDDRCCADALYSGIRGWPKTHGDQAVSWDLPDGVPLLFAGKRLLETYLDTLSPDGREFDLLLRVLALFDGLEQGVRIEG